MFWTKAGKIVVNTGGDPIECANCPCNPVIPGCCTTVLIPATATMTYTIQGLSPSSKPMTRIGTTGYDAGTYDCDVGDGHTHVYIQALVACFSSSGYWAVSFSVSVYVDGVLSSYVAWQAQVNIGSSYSYALAVCNPFHFHYEGLNANGFAAASTVTCGGINYPFVTGAGGLNLILDIVTP